MFSICHSFSGRYVKVRSLVTNQGPFVLRKIEQTEYAEVNTLVKDVRNLCAKYASGISQIVDYQ